MIYRLLAITAGACAIPAALASVYARPTIFVAVVTLFVPMALLAVRLEQTELPFAPAWCGGCVAIAALIVLIIAAQVDRDVVQHRRAKVAVWHNIETRILQVRAVERSDVELPQRLPYPHHLPDYIGSSINGGEYIIGYYRLPNSTTVHTPQRAESTAAN